MKNNRAEIDRKALELAMATVMEDDGRRRQIANMLQEQSWIEVAKFAAHSCQFESLRLKPWEIPPCSINDDEMDTDGGRLLQRMLDAGVSRYHPDPLKELKEADDRQSHQPR
jgi:hypothetical protein